jgi:hypothetical protein
VLIPLAAGHLRRQKVVSSRLRGDLDVTTEVAEASDEALDLLQIVATGEVISAEIAILDAVLEHVPHGGKHPGGDGEDRFLSPAASAQAPGSDRHQPSRSNTNGALLAPGPALPPPSGSCSFSFTGVRIDDEMPRRGRVRIAGSAIAAPFDRVANCPPSVGGPCHQWLGIFAVGAECRSILEKWTTTVISRDQAPANTIPYES